MTVFFSASAEAATGPSSESYATCEIVSKPGETLMKLNVVSSESVPPLTEVIVESAIEMEMVDLTGDTSPFRPPG